MPDTKVILHNQLDSAAQALLNGQLVAFPTDTVYGVAALATSAAAVVSLFDAKKRPPTQPLPVMVFSPDLVDKIALPTSSFHRLARFFWPGPLTLILPKRGALPDVVTGGLPSVGIRIPDHVIAMKLLRLVDQPLAVSSANLSGLPPVSSAQAVVDQLGGRIRFVIDGGRAPGGRPSTVLDLTVSPACILRTGPVTMEQLSQVLDESVVVPSEERSN